MKKIVGKKKLFLYGCSGLGVNMMNIIVGSYLCSALMTGGFIDDIESWTYLNKTLVVAGLWATLRIIAKAFDGIIDLPLAIGFGLFVGALTFVPYLQMVSIPLAVLLARLKAAETGENFWGILLMVALVYIIVQLIQDLVIVPKIMGHIMGISPAIILLSLSVWGSLLGFTGLIIALPLTTLILSYYRRFIIKEVEKL